MSVKQRRALVIVRDHSFGTIADPRDHRNDTTAAPDHSRANICKSANIVPPTL